MLVKLQARPNTTNQHREWDREGSGGVSETNNIAFCSIDNRLQLGESLLAIAEAEESQQKFHLTHAKPTRFKRLHRGERDMPRNIEILGRGQIFLGH